jgi:D-alanine-D-alanine ligase
MDKPLAKQVFATVGLRCPEGKVLSVESLLKSDPFPRPYVAKPAAEGSSVGVRIVRDGDNLPPLGSGNWPFGSEVLVERYIPGRELTVAVMGGEALAVTELRPRCGFYDYEAKYTEGGHRASDSGTGVGEVWRGGEEHGGRRAWRLDCRGVTP